MRKLFGVAAVALGALGVLTCAAVLGLGWLTAARIVGGIDRVVIRLDKGLAEIDSRLAGVESRMSAIRAELEDVREEGESLVADEPELPRVREAAERLLDRLGPSLDRANAIADSMRSVAAALRTAADTADEFADRPETGIRARDAADAIDRAANALNTPRDRIDALKTANATRLIRGVVQLAREAVAGADLLADGLASARAEILVARAELTKYRDAVVFRLYAAAAAGTLGLSWAGLGQLCLFNRGRKRLSNRPSDPAPT